MNFIPYVLFESIDLILQVGIEGYNTIKAQQTRYISYITN